MAASSGARACRRRLNGCQGALQRQHSTPSCISTFPARSARPARVSPRRRDRADRPMEKKRAVPRAAISPVMKWTLALRRLRKS